MALQLTSIDIYAAAILRTKRATQNDTEKRKREREKENNNNLLTYKSAPLPE